MTKYSYKATNSDGKVISGSIDSTDRNAALSLLRKDQLRPLSLEEAGSGKSGGKFNLSMSFGGKKIPNDALVIFTRQLSTMVSAGVPLLRALNTLQTQAESPALQSVLTTVVKDVQSGTALGDAFAKHPQAFNSVYVNMVRAGEAAGILDEILKRVAAQQEKSSAMRKKIKSAMTYPIVLLVISLLAFFGLMIFVIPQIGKIIKDLGGPDAELPALTQGMLNISTFMTTRWYILVPAIVGAVFFTRRFFRTPKGKALFHKYILRVPAVGTIVQKVAVARFARTYASLMAAGVNVLEALRVTAGAIGNESYEKLLAQAAGEVKNGKQLSKALEGSKLFPPIVPQMLAVGEETGQTDVVLVKVADFYEEEVDAAIASVSSIIEPVMIVLMGGMVGLIAASVMGPISSLANNVQ